jgi:glycerol dehydrogenase-like iron-containing ADH family enzyme
VDSRSAVKDSRSGRRQIGRAKTCPDCRFLSLIEALEGGGCVSVLGFVFGKTSEAHSFHHHCSVAFGNGSL